MFTKFTITFLAGAFALVSAAAPADARSGRDNRNLIAGIAVGAIVGAAIASNSKQRKHHGGHVSRSHQNVYGSGHQRGYASSHNRGFGHHKGHRSRHVSLPGACRVHSRHQSGYSGRCLSGYNYSHSTLPSACAVRVGGHHGTIYRDNCLNRYGYH